MLAAAGLAVLLGGTWTDVTVAAGLGAVVGLLLLPEVPPRIQVLLVVVMGGIAPSLYVAGHLAWSRGWLRPVPHLAAIAIYLVLDGAILAVVAALQAALYLELTRRRDAATVQPGADAPAADVV